MASGNRFARDNGLKRNSCNIREGRVRRGGNAEESPFSIDHHHHAAKDSDEFAIALIAPIVASLREESHPEFSAYAVAFA